VAMAFTDWAVFNDHRDVLRSHELIGTRVAPLLRKADPGRGTATASASAALKQTQNVREAMFSK
jgi:hypothetical protein